MFFLFYPNAANPLSLLLFPVTKVIHVPGCWFIPNETFIAHSAALAMFLWDSESSVMSFVLVSLFLYHGIMNVTDPGSCWPFWGALRRGLC